MTERKYCVLSVGDSYHYTIPNFTVLSVKLRHATIQHTDDEGLLKLVDVFVRDDKPLQMKTSFTIDVAESCLVNVSQ